jgi:hypothetical protein
MRCCGIDEATDDWGRCERTSIGSEYAVVILMKFMSSQIVLIDILYRVELELELVAGKDFSARSRNLIYDIPLLRVDCTPASNGETKSFSFLHHFSLPPFLA